jgi:hypothetical protein
MKPPVAEAVSPPEPPRPPVHELSPNVPVVPVVITKGASTTAVKAPADLQGGLSGDSKGKPKAPASDIPAAKTKSGSTLTIPRETAEKKPIPDKRQVTKNTRLNSPKLDLSLPPDLVKQMTPPSSVITPNRKPILPQMFGDKERSDAESFELNGRLLSNEMQLQMRNDNHREVEGAALDFKFKQ